MIWGFFDMGRLLRNDFYSDLSLRDANDDLGGLGGSCRNAGLHHRRLSICMNAAGSSHERKR